MDACHAAAASRAPAPFWISPLDRCSSWGDRKWESAEHTLEVIVRNIAGSGAFPVRCMPVSWIQIETDHDDHGN
jgi:hypothetical protein